MSEQKAALVGPALWGIRNKTAGSRVHVKCYSDRKQAELAARKRTDNYSEFEAVPLLLPPNMAFGPVTERDLRLPEFKDAQVEDLERRKGDGKIVRKDRWEAEMREIADILGFDSRDGFEIEDVIERVRQLANKASPGAP